jgi:monothiol glutaredoxin
MALEERVRSQIAGLLEQNRVVLFMKGTKHFPQCGFSATVVQILNDLVPEYQTVNVLKDPDVREGIKEFSSWPTIPQLYVDGKFVGGCDIVREMYAAGELQSLLGVQDDTKPPTLHITPAAREALTKAQAQNAPGESGMLRLEVSGRFEHEMSLDEKRSADFEIDAGGGLKILVDRMSAKRADGIRIDFVSGGVSEGAGGFSIDNPNEPPRVRGLAPTELKRLLDSGDKLELIDVRSEQEIATARIEGGKAFEDIEQQLEDMPRDTKLVFYCHSGVRSRNAAERFVKEGFTRVYNLDGGIDAWSQQVDPSVKRY